MLYKRADHHNPKWTARLKIPSTNGFVVRSTKTVNDSEARRFAEDLYYKLEGRARRGEPINAPTFSRVFTEWSGTQNIDLKIRSKKYINGNIRRIEIWLLAYFRDTPIDLVTENRLGDYAEWRQGQMSKPAVQTLKNERTALNQMFRFAKRRGYIREIPDYKIKSAKSNARPDITEAEWTRLCKYLPIYIDRAQDKRRLRERYYLAFFILILANTGIRVGEARKLRWRDISSTLTLSQDVRAVLTVRGKTGEREVVCNIGVDRLLDELNKFRREELGQEPPVDEFVFAHQNGSPVGSFKNGFNRVLREAGILFGSDGKRRVPYSLRHTYATMRISEGVNVFQLAANMGTSVEMIDDFYGKKRVRDPKMATEITKQSSIARP